MAKQLTYGAQVKIVGSKVVGQYQGILCAERPLCRVYYVNADGHSGVLYVERKNLRALPEHPVCLHRRVKRDGIRPQRERHAPIPACYTKDYGKTTEELATEAFWQGLEDGVGGDELRQLCGAMLHYQGWGKVRTRPRRLAKATP